MIGYCPLREPDELFAGVITRALAITHPGAPRGRIGRLLFGDRDKRLCAYFPNNARALLESLPELSGVSAKDVIDGSLYHLVTPLLSKREARELRESLFSGNVKGRRSHLVRRGESGTKLRYCPFCAAEDAANGKRPYWRVLHCHPGVVCCEFHRSRLIEVVFRHGVPLEEVDSFLGPSGADPPTPANSSEVAIAEDVRYVYELRSTKLPGSLRLAGAVREALLESAEVSGGRTQLYWAPLRAAIIRRFGGLVREIDPALCARGAKQALHETLWGDSWAPLQRYIMLAHLAGVRIKEIVDRAMIWGSARSRREHAARQLESNKRVVLGLLTEYPGVTRTDLYKRAELHIIQLRKMDPKWYRERMPADRSRGCDREFWIRRDPEFVDRLKRLVPAVRSCRFRTKRELLIAAEIPLEDFYRHKGDLTETWRFVNRIFPQRKVMSRDDFVKEDCQWERRIRKVGNRSGRKRRSRVSILAAAGIDRNEFYATRELHPRATRLLNSYFRPTRKWNLSDEELVPRIKAYVITRSADSPITRGELFRAVGVCAASYYKARPSIPRGVALIDSIVQPRPRDHSSRRLRDLRAAYELRLKLKVGVSGSGTQRELLKSVDLPTHNFYRLRTTMPHTAKVLDRARRLRSRKSNSR